MQEDMIGTTRKQETRSTCNQNETEYLYPPRDSKQAMKQPSTEDIVQASQQSKPFKKDTEKNKKAPRRALHRLKSHIARDPKRFGQQAGSAVWSYLEPSERCNTLPRVPPSRA
ncbi:hypothetical protein BDV93DRAFT_521418 [Ceratobasidium sp. AG-I]|nr:hypothetical protein BDV93DRAFT_521418 [Ceratobasidium sp. AG-I]